MNTITERQYFAQRAWEHVRYLSAELGARMPASPNYQAASQYIEQHLRNCGLEVESQEWDAPAWQELETRLTVNGIELSAVANAFSPSCQVSTQLVPVGTLAELETAELTGKIGLLCGELTMHPLSPKTWFLASEQELHMIDLLEKKQPAALITAHPRPGDLERLIEDDDFHIPSVTVSSEVGRQLLENLDHEVHLILRTHSEPGRARNLVGRSFHGRGPRLVLCAHYDTKVDTPGATDNASGVAVLLCLAEYFQHHPSQLDLEFVAFGSEEYLPIGDTVYLQNGAEELLPNMLAAINVDGIGRKLGVNSIAMFSESPAFHQRVEAIRAGYPSVVWTEPWPESNHSTFAWRGVPSIAMTARGGPYLHHLRHDSLEWIDAAQLAEATALLSEIVADLATRSLAWTHPAVDLE